MRVLPKCQHLPCVCTGKTSPSVRVFFLLRFRANFMKKQTNQVFTMYCAYFYLVFVKLTKKQ